MDSVGIAKDGSVEIPSDIRDVGWYSNSALPSSKNGSTVFVGHRDGITATYGSFYDLSKLRIGDTVLVRTGKSLVFYAVSSTQILSDKEFSRQSGKIFSVKGKPSLKMISCIGPYIKKKGGYQSNIIVTAVPGPLAALSIP